MTKKTKKNKYTVKVNFEIEIETNLLPGATINEIEANIYHPFKDSDNIKVLNSDFLGVDLES